jgi:2-oxoglutarate ferredoxin oxidoreductase subunit alpha
MYGDYIVAHTHVGVATTVPDLGPLPAKDWALDGSMGGTGRARQIWTWDRGKPNTPGVGPDQHWKDVAAKYAALEPGEARWEERLVEDADVVVTAWGTTATVVDYVVDELRADGVRIGSFRPVTLWPFPGPALAQALAGARLVLVYELNAGQMLDDVRIHAPDRGAIRFIGSVSQDQTGMRQGDLLDAAVLRDRVLTALKEAP